MAIDSLTRRLTAWLFTSGTVPLQPGFFRLFKSSFDRMVNFLPDRPVIPDGHGLGSMQLANSAVAAVWELSGAPTTSWPPRAPARRYSPSMPRLDFPGTSTGVHDQRVRPLEREVVVPPTTFGQRVSSCRFIAERSPHFEDVLEARISGSARDSDIPPTVSLSDMYFVTKSIRVQRCSVPNVCQSANDRPRPLMTLRPQGLNSHRAQVIWLPRFNQGAHVAHQHPLVDGIVDSKRDTIVRARPIDKTYAGRVLIPARAGLCSLTEGRPRKVNVETGSGIGSATNLLRRRCNNSAEGFGVVDIDRHEGQIGVLVGLLSPPEAPRPILFRLVRRTVQRSLQAVNRCR